MARSNKKQSLDERQLFDQAWKLKRKGLLKESIDAYKKVIRKFPDTVEARYAKGQIGILERQIDERNHQDNECELMERSLGSKKKISAGLILVLILLFLFIVVVPNVVLYYLVGLNVVIVIFLIMLWGFAVPIIVIFYAPVTATVSIAESGAPARLGSFVAAMYNELKKGVSEMRQEK